MHLLDCIVYSNTKYSINSNNNIEQCVSSSAPVITVQWDTWQRTHAMVSIAPNIWIFSKSPVLYMSIIKGGLRNKIDSLILFKDSMATGMEAKPEDVYANTNTQTIDTNKFEERFSFRRSSDLPPPIPSKEGITTLNRTGTGTKPKVTPIQPGSPRTHLESPRTTSTKDWDSKDVSFKSGFSSTKHRLVVILVATRRLFYFMIH